jgi:hypothetical protein
MSILSRLRARRALRQAQSDPENTARIVPSTTFLHGTRRYQEGVETFTTPAEAYYFALQGWVEGSQAVIDGGPAELDVHNILQTTTTSRF